MWVVSGRNPTLEDTMNITPMTAQLATMHQADLRAAATRHLARRVRREQRAQKKAKAAMQPSTTGAYAPRRTWARHGAVRSAH
jgi:hypothetical protein